MKLQLALDLQDIDKGLEMVHKTKDYVDVFELGTGFMGAHGYDLVKIFRAAFPDIQLLADVKTVDGGYSTSKKMFDYGANFATVVGYGDMSTVAGAVQAAREAGPGHYAMADLMHIQDYSAHKDKLNKAGMDYVCAHIAVDSEGQEDHRSYEEVLSGIMATGFDAKVAVAGGLTLERIPLVKKYNVDMVIIGRAILNAEDPGAAAKAFKEA